MSFFQRFILVLLLITIVAMPFLISYHRKTYAIDKRIEAETEYFFEQICKNACISWEEYQDFRAKLQVMGCDDEIFIQEYQKQYLLNGKEYRVLILWEEICDVLRKEKMYHFLNESEVRLYIGEDVLYGKCLVGEEK